ncbi:hypothetical protein A0O34_21215 [Chryseobacterium glaciei]|uniref:Uncharacterized protein n=1 Tax=Chryseobacterium glaciei TaxID=1685010 RepID=A0A172Y1F4_9FLAO|nr:hypothetical protein [Chryseobacterium glaciei]ANF52885.1 hypothetical protein A0O34_21215 [Chryseobacterium glaciei]
MKRIILFLIIGLNGFVMAQDQRVGIDTDTPTRKLDINGNLRVSSTNTVTDNAAYDRIVTGNNVTGDIDFINVSAISQTETNNVEVKRSVYNALVPDETKECNCGDISFRINNLNVAEIKLNSPTIFVTNGNITSFNVGYGIKRWINSTYNFINRTITFTNSNYLTYQTLDPTAFTSGANYTVRIYTIVPPKQNNLYRLTLSRVSNTNINYTYGLICEKFYIQTL